jgi:hypothetical protein
MAIEALSIEVDTDSDLQLLTNSTIPSRSPLFSPAPKGRNNKAQGAALGTQAPTSLSPGALKGRDIPVRLHPRLASSLPPPSFSASTASLPLCGESGDPEPLRGRSRLGPDHRLKSDSIPICVHLCSSVFICGYSGLAFMPGAEETYEQNEPTLLDKS